MFDLIWIVVAIVAVLFIALIAVFVTKYRTAGPDEALIVTGSYLGSKNVHIDPEPIDGSNSLFVNARGNKV
ncbi:hypothetical protein ACQKM1_02470 [Peribacillus frigoritolerans]|uniref:hypothetical protein n=1 Tax=Peribacillus frigoritolerans TaxID=450367 RepID=UPI003D039CB8